MHDTAYETGRRVISTYWQPNWSRVLDFGAFNVNGSLRDFCPAGATWTGVDLEAGPGVDQVVAAGARLPFDDASFDMVVSTSVFEHDPCFWETFLELCRVVAFDGVIYLNAPSNGKVHKHPLDCWRFYPDAGEALKLWAARKGFGLDLKECSINPQGGDGWADFVAVFQRKL
jgi:SAM-dependent methyltransferase